jgi:hypothetical protein
MERPPFRLDAGTILFRGSPPSFFEDKSAALQRAQNARAMDPRLRGRQPVVRPGHFLGRTVGPLAD